MRSYIMRALCVDSMHVSVRSIITYILINIILILHTCVKGEPS